MTSSRPGELANDADARNHASLFTHHLAKGIVEGAEDHDGDGIVTLSELYDYVRSALADEGRQVPQKRFEGDGDVALARRTVDHVDHMPADLVDPAASAPVLDLSETAIHLGEVGRDERLPPERIAVINRGGGTLDWTAESSASWVEPEAQGSAVVLHLHPRPGPNRANIYVREAGGALKTIRVSVRVRELASSAASETKGRSSETTEPNEPMPRTGGRDEPPSIPLANEVAMPPPTPPPPQPPPPPVTLQPPPLRQRVRELFRPKSDHAWSWLFVAGVGLLGFFCGLPPLILGLMNLRQPNRRKQSLVLIAIAGLWWIVILASSA